jgi:hypothetical protein
MQMLFGGLAGIFGQLAGQQQPRPMQWGTSAYQVQPTFVQSPQAMSSPNPLSQLPQALFASLLLGGIRDARMGA